VAVQHPLVVPREYLHYLAGEIVVEAVDRIQYHMYILLHEKFLVGTIVEGEIEIPDSWGHLDILLPY
jgi:hypothetical protein